MHVDKLRDYGGLKMSFKLTHTLRAGVALNENLSTLFYS
jgi:hypothetical protein